MEGIKNDSNKIRWELLPFRELEDVVKVLSFGSDKYSDNNWKQLSRDRILAALLRHIVAYKQSLELHDPKLKLDDETNVNHLAHAICNCLFLLWFDNNE
jgi:hypothetical protein